MADPDALAEGTPIATVPPRLSNDEIERLLLQAEMHGVLPIVLANMNRSEGRIGGESARADAKMRVHASIGFSLMLRQLARPVLAQIEAEGLSATIVKGPVFANRLYPDRTLRRFTDIDLLASPDAVSRLGEILGEVGYILTEWAPAQDPAEWKWLHRDRDDVMIEVQSDLVHALSLRRAVSLTYETLKAGRTGRLDDPASLLTVALVHGACHHFERLIHVVDILQAARHLHSSDDKMRFVELAQSSGALWIAAVGLDLAARMFGERHCSDLASCIPGHPSIRLARLLISRSTITSTMDTDRNLHAWRRAVFRAVMKRKFVRCE